MNRSLPDGYHSIETLMYPLSLNDALEIVESNSPQSSLHVQGLEIKDTPEQDNLCLNLSLLKEDYHNCQM